MIRAFRLGFIVAVALTVGGCNVEDLLASDFRKFTRCVESTSKDGLIQKGVAKQVCAAKYSSLKKVKVEGHGQFDLCFNSPCQLYKITGLNMGTKTVITRFDIVINASGRPINAHAENLWIEPGGSFATWTTLDTPATEAERKSVSWSIREVHGIDIDE